MFAQNKTILSVFFFFPPLPPVPPAPPFHRLILRLRLFVWFVRFSSSPSFRARFLRPSDRGAFSLHFTHHAHPLENGHAIGPAGGPMRRDLGAPLVKPQWFPSLFQLLDRVSISKQQQQQQQQKTNKQRKQTQSPFILKRRKRRVSLAPPPAPPSPAPSRRRQPQREGKERELFDANTKKSTTKTPSP